MLPLIEKEKNNKRPCSANNICNNLLNDSFETSLSRASRNIYELRDLIKRNKINNKFPLKKRFISNEKEYTKEINTKLLKVAKIIDRVPHPRFKTEKQIPKTNNSPNKKILPKIEKSRPQSSSHIVKKQAHYEDLLEKLENEIKEIFYKKENNNQFKEDLHENSPSNFTSGCLRYKKLQTIYKFINDPKTSIKFHYMLVDFTPKHINEQLLPNPEYKFIKIKNESFFVVGIFLKVLKLIISYFHLIYDNDSFLVRDYYTITSNYCKHLTKKYEVYKKELNELVENYSICTKGLLIDNNVYNKYIYDLCDLSNSILKEEVKFYNATNQLININKN